MKQSPILSTPFGPPFPPWPPEIAALFQNTKKATVRLARPDCGFRDESRFGWCPIQRRVPRLRACLDCEARRTPRVSHADA